MPDFPDWAAERDAPSECPPGFYHWEQAALLFVRDRVERRSWPAPYAGVGLGQVDETRRRQLVGDCCGLRCQEHVYFSKAEVDRMIEGARYTTKPKLIRPTNRIYKLGSAFAPIVPHTFATEEAIYVAAEHAVTMLIHEGIPPSLWPDVYERRGAPEPALSPDKNRSIRALFSGYPGYPAGVAFMLEHAIQKVAIDLQALAAREAAAVVNRFNYEQSTAALRYRAEVERQQFEIAQRSAIAVPLSSQIEPQVGPAAALQLATQRPQWHADAEAMLRKHGVRAKANFVWEELAAMEGYRGGVDVLHTPGGFEITFKTLENKLSELRRKLSDGA